MDVIIPSQVERTEMDLLLQSGIFDKAPRLGRFFRYICERYFEGQADQIKEYSIALEALDRPAEFDPKKDSIVRVEAHRLRKRLDEYYRGPGAGHRIRIVIPNGQYRPHFIVKEAGEVRPLRVGDDGRGFSPVDLEAVSRVQELPPSAGRRGKFRALWPLALLVVGAGVLGTVLVQHTFQKKPFQKKPIPVQPVDEVWSGAIPDPVPAEFRMLAGYHGAPFVDRQGHTWGPDAYYKGGRSTPIPADRFIEGQPDPHLLKAQRTGQFRYDIPIGQGTHELHLYFAEIEFGRGNPAGGGEGSRTFQIVVNGVSRFAQFDPLAEAGAPNRLHETVLKDIVPAEDGKLHLNFVSGGRVALLNAIEIVPSTPGKIHPVRIVTQANPVTDSDGRVWAADEYFSGGTPVFRRNVVANPLEKAIYQGERYGNFSYVIPLAAGKYRLTLHFAETWFGTPESRLPALDSRVFDVYANGVALLRNYQIAKDAGGPNRSIEKVFEKLEPNAQGVLRLEFIPVRNYAEVNAIEVVETE